MTKTQASTIIPLVFVIALVALAAGYLAPKGEYFLGNLAIYWVPIAVVLFALALSGARTGVLVGSAAVLTAFLFGFHAWAQAGASREWVWGGYLFAMPGAAIGGLVAAVMQTHRSLTFFYALIAALAATSAGLALNLGLLCATLIQCIGR